MKKIVLLFCTYLGSMYSSEISKLDNEIILNGSPIKPREEVFYANNAKLDCSKLTLAPNYAAYPSKRGLELFCGKRDGKYNQLNQYATPGRLAVFEASVVQIAFTYNQDYLIALKPSGTFEVWNVNNPLSFLYTSTTKWAHMPKCFNYIDSNPNSEEFIAVTDKKMIDIYRLDHSKTPYICLNAKKIKNIRYYDSNSIAVSFKKEKKSYIHFWDIRQKEGDFTLFSPQFVSTLDISLIAVCSNKSLCAFIANNAVTLGDLRNIYDSNNDPQLLKTDFITDQAFTELFFVGETLVAVGKNQIYFYNTSTEKLETYSLPAYTYAKWHKIAGQLSLKHKDKDATLIYQFPQ